MKNPACAALFLAFLVSSASAQFVSPVPVIEKEIRDNSSVKLRSIELERVKRDARKPQSEKLGPAEVNNFLEIKADFEKIQILEGGIVAAYKTGKQIQFNKIAAFSAELNQSALRLKRNLFSIPIKDEKNAAIESESKSKSRASDLKGLIVELDASIGAFVNNPIFRSPKKARLKEKERAVTDLERVIELSVALQREAEKRTSEN
ncbi:MAG TPA: hypothetical protein VIL74_18620 [Pyrinomonadaceae bacterium]|jgi:hypothetical protein